jgi:hypothetical protein
MRKVAAVHVQLQDVGSLYFKARFLLISEEVEDQEPTFAVLTRLLRQKNHHVLTATTVQNALHSAI